MAYGMVDHYDLIQQLTSAAIGDADPRRRLNDFAVELGWRPSDHLSLPGTEEFASGHLVVEHGLQNSAIISFLRRPVRFTELDSFRQKKLLNASYNNLIEWHIAIDYDGASFIYNRVDPPKFFSYRRSLSRDGVSGLSSAAFDKFSADHPSPNVPALDTALIRTISFWKRQFSADITGVSNEDISALFNAIILVRAVEDHSQKSQSPRTESLRSRALNTSGPRLSRVLLEALSSFNFSVPLDLVDTAKLSIFDSLDSSAVRELIEDFYQNRYERYFDYDFSIMSKHALSRIYEHYVSLLRFRDVEQESFFPVLPEERLERSFGNVYTPEFIARFFAKYVRKEVALSKFQKMSIGDPACGSGIFLRTMLETKFDSLFESLTTQSISDGFKLVTGVDVDQNACAATRLSLSLLSLVLAGAVPDHLNIYQADTLKLFKDDASLQNSLDVVVANPPFVNIEDLPAERRDLLLEVLGDAGRGKTDLYLGILSASIDMLKNDGFGLFVLPKNFLISENAAPIREKLLLSSTVHCVVDLSAVRVFEQVGAYVILLIFQKQETPSHKRPVLVAQCSDLVGMALEDALQDREVRTPAYEVYWSKQPRLSDKRWDFAPPELGALQEKFGRLPKLEDIAELRQGLITGADDIFIVAGSEVPKGEKNVYVPFLPDREIEPYHVAQQAKRYVIYPFDGNDALDESSFRIRYPKTWEYLLKHKPKLTARRSVESGKNPWWRPIRPREPRMLLRPKIVTPHLVISPRFALDVEGRFAVSHTPYIVPKAPGSLDELLYLLGVLNSTPCFWVITQNAHNYSRGYSRLEVATLRTTPIPDPSRIEKVLLREIIKLVGMRLEATGASATSLEKSIDDRVADAYELSSTERRLVGLGAYE